MRFSSSVWGVGLYTASCVPLRRICRNGKITGGSNLFVNFEL